MSLVLNKAIKIILSCKTHDHLHYAKKYVKIAIQNGYLPKEGSRVIIRAYLKLTAEHLERRFALEILAEHNRGNTNV